VETNATAAGIGARLDRLPMSRHIWGLVALLSLGGAFEFYDLFMTAYISPALVAEGIFSKDSGLFGLSDQATFAAATFAGLFLGTIIFSQAADRLGRRAIFTWSLLWYTAATIAMACQSTAHGLHLWRFISGIGLGVEMVTIDAYITELVARHVRGRALAINQAIQFTAVPTVAIACYFLTPHAPFGVEGWRWVMLAGAVGAAFVWVIRARVPESPRWLVSHGRLAEADRITRAIEQKVEAEVGPLPAPAPVTAAASSADLRGRFVEIFQPPYRRRTIMLAVFNFAQCEGTHEPGVRDKTGRRGLSWDEPPGK
jgi:putative MFS transporter